FARRRRNLHESHRLDLCGVEFEKTAKSAHSVWQTLRIIEAIHTQDQTRSQRAHAQTDNLLIRLRRSGHGRECVRINTDRKSARDNSCTFEMQLPSLTHGTAGLFSDIARKISCIVVGLKVDHIVAKQALHQ